jgi:hypothetical protein
MIKNKINKENSGKENLKKKIMWGNTVAIYSVLKKKITKLNSQPTPYKKNKINKNNSEKKTHKK